MFLLTQCHPKLAFTRFILLLSLTSLCYLSQTYGQSFDVGTYGAIGDGKTDDTQAFVKAWQAACQADGSVSVTIPQGKTFMIGPTTFQGPCKASQIGFQINGGITAPSSVSGWGTGDKAALMSFDSVNGLVIDGTGTIDGQGSVWWPGCKTTGCGERPKTLRLYHSNNAVLKGITVSNSPFFHVYIQSDNVYVSNIHISSPEDSPNTDGIHVQQSNNVTIEDCVIKTGDDCVSITSGTVGVNVTRVTCGPGHGISVGSLGKGGNSASVEKIQVLNCNLTGTTNGVRIKTWEGGSGYARNIIFSGIGMNNVKNPIIINQQYSDATLSGAYPNQASAVAISEVSYIGITGSSASDAAITLDCSQSKPCTGIILNNVNLAVAGGKPATSSCKNAQITTQGTVQPAVTCS